MVYKTILEEGNNGEKEIADKSRKIAELLGLYVQCDFLLPMMVSHLQDSESKNVPRYVTSCLTSLASVIKNSSMNYSHQLSQYIPRLIDLILHSDYLQSENPEVLFKCL